MRKRYSVLIVCVGLLLLINSCRITGKAAGPSVTENVTQYTKQAVSNAPAYCMSPFNVSGDELIVCYDDENISEETKNELEKCIEMFSSEGYRVGLLLYDLNSGQGICYHGTDEFYSASTIKGPYVACIAEKIPSSVSASRSVIEETIHVSSNEGYEALWKAYGNEVFQEWVEEAGCKSVDVTTSRWTDLTAQQLGLMWVHMYDYLTSGTEDAEWLASVYTGTLNSCIYNALGENYTVYSKAGWINTSDYYNVQNDAGIVMKGDNPYVLVVLSNAYDRMDLLEELVRVADKAHTQLVGS